jgi:N-glycosylase/DNA lyase
LTGEDGIITLSVEIGIPAGVQLSELFQAVLLDPSQVFWANVSNETSIAMITKKADSFFMGF